MRTIQSLLIYLFFSFSVYAEEFENYRVLNTKVHHIKSNIIDHEFDIFIGLPFSYDPQKRYPIVMVLDADVMFGMVTQYAQLKSFENSLVQYITVGVGYGDFRQWFDGRNRDYHPPKGDQSDSGAAVYLNFIEQELIPYISSNYKIDDSRKILYGHSSGGLFALYVALNSSKFFSSVIASSPSLEWENELFINRLQPVAAKTLPDLYISVSDSEKKTIHSIDRFFAKQPIDKKRLNYRKFKNQTHMGVIPLAYAKGIAWILGLE